MTLTLTPTIDPTLDAELDDLAVGLLGPGNTPLAVTDAHIDATIDGGAVSFTLTHTWTNPTDTTVEAVLVCPVPARFALTEAICEHSGKRLVAELRERGEARAAHQAAVDAGIRSALVEEDRTEVITISVGSLTPGADAKTILTLVGRAEIDANRATLRLPTLVAPRYTAGTPLGGAQAGGGEAEDTDAAPDASRVTPPRTDGPTAPVTAVLSFKDGRTITNLATGTHTAAIAPATDTTDLTLTIDKVTATRDIVVRWSWEPIPVGDHNLTATFVRDPKGPPTAGKTGTGTVVINAGFGPSTTNPRPRDVVVTIDRSGSMGGWKQAAANRAAARIVDALGEGDRFAIVDFDTTITTDGPLRDATDANRWKGVSYIAGLTARGRTHLAEAIQTAANLFDKNRAADKYIVVITDGQVSAEDRTINIARNSGAKVVAVGIDTAANDGLLTRLAGRNRQLVHSPEDAETAGTWVVDLVVAPAVSNVKIKGKQIVDGTTAGDGPDCPHNVTTVLAARTTGTPKTIKLVGTGPDGTPVEHVVPVTEATDGPAGALWARGWLREAQDRLAAGLKGPDTETIVATSLGFGVLCRHTAFVAVDPDGEVVNDGESTVLNVPVGQPDGWDRMNITGAVTRGARLRGGTMFGASLNSLATEPAGGPIAGGPVDQAIWVSPGCGTVPKRTWNSPFLDSVDPIVDLEDARAEQLADLLILIAEAIDNGADGKVAVDARTSVHVRLAIATATVLSTLTNPTGRVVHLVLNALNAADTTPVDPAWLRTCAERLRPGFTPVAGNEHRARRPVATSKRASREGFWKS